MKFSRPGHNGLEVKYESMDLDGGETGPRWSSDAVLVTWVEVRHDMDRGETQISRRGMGEMGPG